MVSEFCIRDPTIKIFIYGFQEFKDLINIYSETHSLEQIMELVSFNIVILVEVDFIEGLLQRHSSLS